MLLWLDACSRHQVPSEAPWAARSSSVLSLEKSNPFPGARALPPSSPPPISVYISWGERGWVSSWAAVPGRTPRTAGFAAPGSAFPASPASSLANSGLPSWQQRGRRAREDERVNTVKPGSWSLAGSRKWVAGGDRVCFPCCCCPSVSREMFLLRRR